MRVTKSYAFEAAHVLPGYEGKCSRLHGHSYKVEVTVEGPIQQEGPDSGMVIDFTKLKEVLEEVVGPWDHHFLSARLSEPHAAALVRAGLKEDVVRLDIPRTTAEYLAKVIFHDVSLLMYNKGLGGFVEPELVEVTVWETATGRATYRLQGEI